MYVSEHTFDRLRAAADERFTQELEYRRIALEREAEAPPAPTTHRSLRERLHGFRRSEYPALGRLSHP